MPETVDDRALVARAALGDEQAFRTLVARHEGAVAAMVTAMLGPGDEADDAGQDTFVRFFHALPTFRGEAAVRTYLTRIAINLSLDALARRKRRVGWLRLGGDEPVELADERADDGARLETNEGTTRVRRALATLEPAQRAVVVLRILEERSTRETAELLAIPEGTVMSRLKRALAKLAPLLTEQGR